MAASKIRLDQLLVQRGLAETRSRAQALILAGSVRVAGELRHKPGDLVLADVALELAETLPYVSRGGLKLAHALDSFGLLPSGLVALDVGASTGGFTDVLLQRGAALVYAVDVGYGQIDWRLRQDARVVVLDRTNIRYLAVLPAVEQRRKTEDDRRKAEDVGSKASDPPPSSVFRPPSSGYSVSTSLSPLLADCAVIDTSFISLKLVLPAVQRLITPDAWVVALIKPQFEAGAKQVGKGGVVRDPAVHMAVLHEVLAFATGLGLVPHGLARSPITGPAGNIEFLAWLGGSGPELAVEAAIKAVVSASG